jgi:hypothetical protein
MAGSSNTADWFARPDLAAIVGWARTLGSEVAWRLTTLALALLMLFFIYRDGDKFIEQVATISDLMCNACSKKGENSISKHAFQSSANWSGRHT